MGPEKEMLPGGGGHKEAPPLPHKGGPPQPPTVAQYESIIKHLQKANDTMAHEVMGDTVQTPLPMTQYRPHCLGHSTDPTAYDTVQAPLPMTQYRPHCL